MSMRMICAAALAAVVASPHLGAAKTVKIGYMDTFSGGFAIYGRHQKDGLELALDHLGRKIGGLDVEVIYGDTQRKPDVARLLAEKFLKKDRVDFIAGIMFSNVLAAVQKLVTRSKTILISTNAGWSGMAGKKCSPYFFSTSWQNDQPSPGQRLIHRDYHRNTTPTARLSSWL